MSREIPIITDELAQPEFGTGAVKVTPAHDPNDFKAGQRHNLPQINIMDEHAHMNANAGVYAGLDRYEARKRVLADLQEQGFLVGEKDHALSIGKCDPLRHRSRAPPFPSSGSSKFSPSRKKRLRPSKAARSPSFRRTTNRFI